MAALIHGWLLAEMFAGSACDWATCADGMAALCHGNVIVANHLPTATSTGASGSAPIVGIAAITRRRLMAHLVSTRACHWAARTLRVATVRHCGGVMTKRLVHATVHWACAHRTPVVAVATLARRWAVADVLSWRARHWAASTLRVAAPHGIRMVVAQDLIQSANHRLRSSAFFQAVLGLQGTRCFGVKVGERYAELAQKNQIHCHGWC